MSSNRLILLDGLRGIAALSVLVFHRRWLTESGHLLDHAYLAVDFFFMLSGFVITLAYQRKIENGMTFRDFFIARVIRLYPLYLVGLSMGAFVWAAKIHSHGYSIFDVFIPFISMLFFLPALRPLPTNTIEAYPLNSPAWSLSFEMLINIIFFLVARLHTKIVVALFIFSAFWLVFSGNQLGGNYYSNLLDGIPRVAASFILGVLLYRFFTRLPKQRIVGRKLGILAFSGLGLVLLISFWPSSSNQYGMTYDFFIIFIVFPIIILAGAAVEIQGNFAYFVDLIGQLSYPIYILHYPLLYIGDIFLENHKTFMFSIWMPTICIFAYCAWRFYDVPARRKLREIANKFAGRGANLKPGKSRGS